MIAPSSAPTDGNVPAELLLATSSRATKGTRAAVRLLLASFALWVMLALLISNVVHDAGDAWTLLLVVLAIGLPFWCCVRHSKSDPSPGIDVFQPGLVLACFVYFYIVIPAVHVWRDLGYHSDWMDPTWPPPRLFHFTFALCILGLIAFGIGYRGYRRAQIPSTAAAVSSAESPRWRRSATALAVAMLVIGLPFRLYHFAAFGGLTPNVLLFLSPTYTVESGIKIGGIPTFLEAFFSWGALLFLLRAVITNKQKLLALVVLLVAISFAYLLSGKRSAVIPFLLYPVIWFHYLKRRISVKRGLAYFAAAFVLVTSLLFMRTIGPLLATNRSLFSAIPADIALAPARFYINSPELAVFDETMYAVQDRGPVLHEIGGPLWGTLQYNVAPALYIVPRFIWPGKPSFKDLGQVFFQRTEDRTGREDVGFAVGIIAGLYVFGGAIGVLLGMTLIGALFRLTHEWVQPWSRDPGRVFIYGIVLWMLFLFLRFGAVGSTLMYFYQFELPGVIIALLVLRGRQPLEQPAPGR